MSFSSKVVLITGAASGIGAATALAFAKQFAKLALIDISNEELDKTIKDCKAISECNVLRIVVDLSCDEEVSRVINETIREYGALDVVINCAGIHGPGNILDDDILQRFDRTMAVNLRAVIAIVNRAAPALIDSKGCIVNISSISATLATRNTLPYNIAKAGVSHFTRCAAIELADKGVRVNSISPGPVKTQILKNSGMSEREEKDFWSNCPESVPLKLLIQPGEIAELAMFLASDNARSITGSDYAIDGGVLLTGPQPPPTFEK